MSASLQNPAPYLGDESSTGADALPVDGTVTGGAAGAEDAPKEDEDSAVPVPEGGDKGKGRAVESKEEEGAEDDEEDDEDEVEDEGEGEGEGEQAEWIPPRPEDLSAPRQPTLSPEPREGDDAPPPLPDEPAPPLPAAAAPLAGAGGWTAIFSPEANAYYFYNTQTGQTTWENPLDPTKAPAAPTSAPAAPSAEKQAPLEPSTSAYVPPEAEGVDPALAYLLPAAQRTPGGLATARFNARTGAFARNPNLTPDHVSEYERGRRQQSFYYDLSSYEAERQDDIEKRLQAEAEGSAGSKRQLSKKELQQFREQRVQKKRKKATAWLTS